MRCATPSTRACAAPDARRSIVVELKLLGDVVRAAVVIAETEDVDGAIARSAVDAAIERSTDLVAKLPAFDAESVDDPPASVEPRRPSSRMTARQPFRPRRGA